jgi:hypothetical protein
MLKSPGKWQIWWRCHARVTWRNAYRDNSQCNPMLLQAGLEAYHLNFSSPLGQRSLTCANCTAGLTSPFKEWYLGEVTHENTWACGMFTSSIVLIWLLDTIGRLQREAQAIMLLFLHKWRMYGAAWPFCVRSIKQYSFQKETICTWAQLGLTTLTSNDILYLIMMIFQPKWIA